MRAYVAELLGTFFLVLAIGLSGNALAIGLALAALVYMGAHVSGAHYNPAVSLGFWVRGTLSGGKLVMYWLAQVIGGLLAACAVFVLAGAPFVPAPSAPFWPAVLVEVLFTFLIVIVYLTLSGKQRPVENDVYGLAIGFSLVAGVYAGLAISGAVYNPALAIGSLIVGTVVAGAGLADLLLYLLGPLVGGALAAAVFSFLNPKV